MTYKLTKIRQHFPQNSLPAIQAEVQKELARLRHLMKPNASIAIAVGSRGIDNIILIVREVVNFVKQYQAKPFIVPAMGSHGGATAEGQAEILASYDISETMIGAPVRASMETVELPRGSCINPIFMDKHAYNSDGVILINRIKPHTDFHGKYESGLAKMSVIGLGKEKAASVVHQYGIHGLTTLLEPSARQVLATGKILAGLALVENAYDKTMLVRALQADEILMEEPKLLAIAHENMPSLPVDDIDVLIVDRMGKNISGVGIDTNIIGRKKIHGQPEPEKPNIKAILVADLTEESHGNAVGLGLADVITQRLYDKMDLEATYKNALTSTFLERTKIPLVAKNDKLAFEAALRSCGHLPPDREKIIRIKDTLHLDTLYVSQAVVELLKDDSGIEFCERDVALFDGKGDFAAY